MNKEKLTSREAAPRLRAHSVQFRRHKGVHLVSEVSGNYPNQAGRREAEWVMNNPERASKMLRAGHSLRRGQSKRYFFLEEERNSWGRVTAIVFEGGDGFIIPIDTRVEISAEFWDCDEDRVVIIDQKS